MSGRNVSADRNPTLTLNHCGPQKGHVFIFLATLLNINQF